LLLLQLSARFEPVNIRHIDVEHDHPWLEIAGKIDGGLSAVDNLHLSTQNPQELADDFASIMVVVHHQALHRAAINHDRD